MLDIYSNFLELNKNIIIINEKIIKLIEKEEINELLNLKIKKLIKKNLNINGAYLKINEEVEKEEKLKKRNDILALDCVFEYEKYKFFLTNIFELSGKNKKHVKNNIAVRYVEQKYYYDNIKKTNKLEYSKSHVLTNDYIYLEQRLLKDKNNAIAFSLDFKSKEVILYHFVLDGNELRDDIELNDLFFQDYNKVFDFYIMKKEITNEEKEIYEMKTDKKFPEIPNVDYETIYMKKIIDNNTLINKIKKYIRK